MTSCARCYIVHTQYRDMFTKMILQQTLVFTTVAVIFIIFLSGIYFRMTIYNKGFSSEGSKQRFSKETDINKNMDVIWRERSSRIQQVCSALSRNEIEYNIKYGQSRKCLTTSSSLDATICSIPKAGSTYIKTVLLILDNHIPAEEVLNYPRSKVHAVSRKRGGGLFSNGIITSRDPYARLFSAFIDKFFLLRFPAGPQNIAEKLGKGIYMTKAGKCGYNVTFQDFLDTDITGALKGHRMNAHWAPVYTLCRMCNTTYNYVIQQETLTRDLKNIFDKLLTNKTAARQTQKLFRNTSIYNSTAGVIRTMWKGLRLLTMKHSCPHSLAYGMKLWEGFKIQGYIRENRPFPSEAVKNKFDLSAEEFTEIVLKTMMKDPLSRVERKTQRKRALVNAYKKISRNTIADIQEVYKMDFLLFGYDRNPPSN